MKKFWHNRESKIFRLVKSFSYTVPLSFRKKWMDQIYGHFIFSKFEQACFDELGWKYVVPEPVSKNFAAHYRNKKILDAYAGVGGTAIQLALAGNQVTAAELDSGRFACLEHNRDVYDASHNLRLWHGDVQEILKKQPEWFDLICVDPPWKIIKENFAPYLDFFFRFSDTLVFKVPKGTCNQLLVDAGAGEIREIFVNSTMFHKEAFFFKQHHGAPAVMQERVQAPEVQYIFP